MVNRMNEQINEATEVSKSSAETAAAEEKSKEPPKKKNGKRKPMKCWTSILARR